MDADGDRDASLNEIADGLRSGNAFFAHGDLVDALEFTAQWKSAKADMGGDLFAEKGKKGANVTLKIRFKSPTANHNGDAPAVDHVDLIAGEITGPIDPSSPDYTKATNETAKVIASFDADEWETDDEGYRVIVHHVRDLDRSTYFRVRGTNLPCGTLDETGPETALPSADFCSPLPDRLIDTSAGPAAQARAAWNDLWFYGNPVFVYVQ